MREVGIDDPSPTVTPGPSATPITSSKGAASMATLIGLPCLKRLVEEAMDQGHCHESRPRA